MAEEGDKILDSTQADKDEHNCFLLSCELGLQCGTLIEATNQITTILVTVKNTTDDSLADTDSDLQGNEPTKEIEDEIVRRPEKTSELEEPTTSDAALIVVLVCVACFGFVGVAATGHYFYQQYQKRKLYYKLDRVDTNGDFFTSEDPYNYR